MAYGDEHVCEYGKSSGFEANQKRMKSLISFEVVYGLWSAHECKTRPSISAQDRVRLMTEELLRREGWPRIWYRCILEPEGALDLLVGRGWEGWTQWSLPEGTYLRIARKIIETDPNVPLKTITLVRQMAAGLKSMQSPLFEDDPILPDSLASRPRVRRRFLAGPPDAVTPPPAPTELVYVPVFEDLPFPEAAYARCRPVRPPAGRRARPVQPTARCRAA
jgi:hypothetical protein